MSAIGQSLLLTLPLLVAGCLQKTATEPITVGHVAPLSGPEKAAGEQAQRGILLAVEDANREDQLIHGRRVVVMHVDDRGDPEQAQAQAVRVIPVNHVAGLLGGIGPAEAERLVRAGQSYGVPVVALAALPPLPGSDGIVSLAVSPTDQGRALGRFTIQELKPARVAVIADGRGSIGTDLAAAFARELKERPEELIYQNDGDFSDLVKRLAKFRPNVILIAAPARDFLKLAHLLGESGLDAKLIYGGPEGELPLLRADRDGSQGMYLATTYLPEVATPANQEFVKRFQGRFGEPPGVPAALAHDGARLLFDAMRRTRLTDLAELRRELAQTEKFDSLTGPVTFAKAPHASRTVFIARLDKGQPKLVKQYEPEGKSGGVEE